MPRILILDDIAAEGLELLKAAPGVEYEIRTKLAGEPLRAALAEFDGAICRSGVKITAESLAGNRRLKAIARAGVGVDNIDTAAATKQGVVVMNTPGGNTLSTAEHAFTLLLALSRNIAPAHASLVGGKWDKKSFTGAQVAGKTLGVIGMGRIGREVAQRAAAFQMRVIGYDPFFSADQAAKLGVERVESVADMLPRVDYLTVHTPLTAETKYLIDFAQLPLLKPGVRLINAARGGIYNEAALVEGLKSGRVAGVALDVFETEPCAASPLFGMKNVLVTPHLGASTEEAQTQVAVEAAQLLVNFFATGEVRHAVNLGSVDPKTLAGLRGHINVAYRLGLLLDQWREGRAISSCRLKYRGEVADKDTRLVTSAFCAGLLERSVEGVNLVNALALLQERNIAVAVQAEQKMRVFSSSLTAQIEADGQTYLAAGTLFGNDMPRLIQLLEYQLESYLDGNLLIFSHDDVPGIIGAIGTACGKHGVNIAQMSVGRLGDAPGGPAIGVLNLDSPPAAAAVAEIGRLSGVHHAVALNLPPRGQQPRWM